MGGGTRFGLDVKLCPRRLWDRHLNSDWFYWELQGAKQKKALQECLDDLNPGAY